ncbi:polyprenyl synthetase family protein [Chitinophaga sp. Cy-1792]|uniref:polyprenyl synthetase family protein n=1 Tax=Chitinophaga sp. Cy-1792 TaxID=2608339 RepID=UPI0014246A31|nr:polyprenyl synthetase family protein [Chitinophaga sp. Cy-1792]
MKSTDQLRAGFDAWLHAWPFPDQPANLYGAIQYFLANGGKRLRPMLCLLGNELFSGPEAEALHIATAVELFHNYSLVHDDIMDNSPLRRGMDTVHVRYGKSTAIVVGDTLLIKSMEALNRVTLPNRKQIMALFLKTARQICEGQQLDLDQEAAGIGKVSYENYLNMVTMKTAVLLAASITMGAMAAQASAYQQELLYGFGKNLGIAFQLQDDYIDAFGDPATTGKQQGGDIIENKNTALLIKAMELCSPAQQQDLLAAMAVDGPAKVPAVRQLFDACGAGAWVRQEVERYTGMAFQRIDELSIPETGRETLRSLATQLLIRQA